MLNPKGHIICNMEKKTLNKTQNENTPQIASCLHAMQILCDKNNVHIYRLYWRIGRTFFKEKNVRNLGCGLYAGTRGFELINMQNCPTHTESTKITESLTV